jgi:hypothetical protein
MPGHEPYYKIEYQRHNWRGHVLSRSHLHHADGFRRQRPRHPRRNGSPDRRGADQAGAGISCTTLTASGAINQTGGQYIYLRGDASTDGSVRFSSPSAGTMLIEKRDTGSWVSIGSFA